MEGNTSEKVAEHDAPPVLDGAMSHKTAWLDLTVVLLIAVVPNLIWVFMPYQEVSEIMTFNSDMLNLLLGSVPVIAMCAYIILKSEKNFVWHGLVRFQPIRDLAVAIGLTVFYFVSWSVISTPVAMLESLTQATSLGYVFPRFEGGLMWPLMLVAYIANSFAEEGSIRILAASRLEVLLSKPWLAIAIANALFASYHLYQGWLAMVGVFVFGISLSVAFKLTKSIWPLIIGHTIVNITVTLMDSYSVW